MHVGPCVFISIVIEWEGFIDALSLCVNTSCCKHLLRCVTIHHRYRDKGQARRTTKGSRYVPHSDEGEKGGKGDGAA